MGTISPEFVKTEFPSTFIQIMKLVSSALLAATVLADGHSMYEDSCTNAERCDYNCGSRENCFGVNLSIFNTREADRACCGAGDVAEICNEDGTAVSDAICDSLPANMTAINGGVDLFPCCAHTDMPTDAPIVTDTPTEGPVDTDAPVDTDSPVDTEGPDGTDAPVTGGTDSPATDSTDRTDGDDGNGSRTILASISALLVTLFL